MWNVLFRTWVDLLTVSLLGPRNQQGQEICKLASCFCCQKPSRISTHHTCLHICRYPNTNYVYPIKQIRIILYIISPRLGIPPRIGRIDRGAKSPMPSCSASAVPGTPWRKRSRSSTGTKSLAPTDDGRNPFRTTQEALEWSDSLKIPTNSGFSCFLRWCRISSIRGWTKSLAPLKKPWIDDSPVNANGFSWLQSGAGVRPSTVCQNRDVALGGKKSKNTHPHMAVAQKTGTDMEPW